MIMEEDDKPVARFGYTAYHRGGDFAPSERRASKTRPSSRGYFAIWPARTCPACGRKPERLPGLSACFTESQETNFRPRSIHARPGGARARSV